ncbi:hypothetical protein COCSUDRAFT_60353 [Coccomyxa subellipsoidea C-169]|uniref:Cyclin-dependent kinase inhibitor domain-containing protein n=1 Tax=Coccomyxa subellipsoidea (strain C-169) TaxID=574566 RepID=I0YJ20_COCSC|nr:hypothetical protein COCSUDRAFT_60353 [Coccomyxa subellipsoidea C-169]EIE18389.1 hypothetical protein COCSUDRAFT_60353 [Coccomyxa subellipsoidea C-169]|eukprot:XP_005642933.1 hypothetical protein COCSUDRAFT_60353 [Coccomyxa subellipsoidea C-169]
MLHQESSRIILCQKQQEAASLSDALITPDKKLQQQNGSAGSSSRRLFGVGEPTQKDVSSGGGESEEVQSRKRPCHDQCSYDAPIMDQQGTLGGEQTKRQATRRLFGSSPSPEQMDQFFKNAEQQARTAFERCWSIDASKMQPVKDGRWRWTVVARHMTGVTVRPEAI